MYCFTQQNVSLRFCCRVKCTLIKHACPQPLIKRGEGGGGTTFQKLSHLGVVQNLLLERGDKPEKEGLM